jgi:hypothetical protein
LKLLFFVIPAKAGHAVKHCAIQHYQLVSASADFHWSDGFYDFTKPSEKIKIEN